MNSSKNFFFSIKAFTVLIFLVILPLKISHGQITGESDLLSPIQRLKFADHLYHGKDYLRASAEYKEYLKFFSNDSVQFRYADSFYKIGRLAEASDNFKGLFFSPSLSEEARLKFYESNFFQNDFKEFRRLAGQTNYQSLRYRDEIERLKFITYFFDNSPLPAESLLLKPFPDSAQAQLSQFYYQKKFPKSKNPVTAALLSAIIPGAGKIYTGEIGDGITSFLTYGILVYLMIDNFNAQHNTRGYIFGGLALLSYGGTIYGSASSAQIYNARIRLNFDAEVKIYFEKRNYFLPKSE